MMTFVVSESMPAGTLVTVDIRTGTVRRFVVTDESACNGVAREDLTVGSRVSLGDQISAVQLSGEISTR